MPAKAVDLKQAKKHLHELVDQAAQGQDVVLTQGGKPVARIIPITRRVARRRPGSAKGLIHMRDDFDEPIEDFREYM